VGRTRYIAFLRAINVGGHVVKMDVLKKEFQGLGFTNVETFIASGNVVFEAGANDGAALEAKIAARLERALGYEVATFVRTAAELAAVAEHRSFSDAAMKGEGASLYIGFMTHPLGPAAKQTLLGLATKMDDLHTHRREVYWLSKGGFSNSGFSAARMEKTLGLKATFRNVTTVRKMADKFAPKEKD
jgi:uncharacterized protein (DUF1697 family)